MKPIEAKFIPGQFNIEQDDGSTAEAARPSVIISDEKNDCHVAFCFNDNPEAFNLIKAAPDLFSALAKIRRSHFADREKPLWDEIQSALAKARGEPS